VRPAPSSDLRRANCVLPLRGCVRLALVPTVRRSFRENPAFGWGFFQHRFLLYTGAVPHEGYNVMLRWAHAAPQGYHVFTSNVDGCALLAPLLLSLCS
jgi:hypothetical protein